MKILTNVSTLIGGLFLLLGLSSCIDAGETCACGQKSTQAIVALNTPELTKVTESVFHLLSRNLPKGENLEIGVVENNKVSIYYSKPAENSVINDIWRAIDTNTATPELEIMPSNESGLVKAFQQFSDRVSDLDESETLTSFIITEGTDDPETIAKIRYLMGKVAESPHIDQARLSVVGVHPNYRLPLSSAFEPIGDFVEFSSSNYEEYKPLVERIR